MRALFVCLFAHSLARSLARWIVDRKSHHLLSFLRTSLRRGSWCQTMSDVLPCTAAAQVLGDLAGSQVPRAAQHAAAGMGPRRARVQTLQVAQNDRFRAGSSSRQSVAGAVVASAPAVLPGLKSLDAVARKSGHPRCPRACRAAGMRRPPPLPLALLHAGVPLSSPPQKNTCTACAQKQRTSSGSLWGTRSSRAKLLSMWWMCCGKGEGRRIQAVDATWSGRRPVGVIAWPMHRRVARSPRPVCLPYIPTNPLPQAKETYPVGDAKVLLHLARCQSECVDHQIRSSWSWLLVRKRTTGVRTVLGLCRRAPWRI